MGVDGIKQQIVAIGQTLGFADVRVSKSDPGEATDRLMAWLEKGYHGEMAFMSRYRHIRADPTQLVKNAVRVISVRLIIFRRILKRPKNGCWSLRSALSLVTPWDVIIINSSGSD